MANRAGDWRASQVVLLLFGLPVGSDMVTGGVRGVRLSGAVLAVVLAVNFRAVYLTVLPSEFASGLLTGAVAFSYGRIGVGAVGLAAVVLFVFQYLVRGGVQAFERGEELSTRTKELASLQVGLLSTVM